MLISEYLTPKRIVEQLDKYIIGQDQAKHCVAIALRNRWRRQQISGDIKGEIMPNNIILIGPTGVGKTEIARRLSRLTDAPFIKVEASKFTEVGYVGRDVESMVRELMNYSVSQVRERMIKEVRHEAENNATDMILDILIPRSKKMKQNTNPGTAEYERYLRSREKMRKKLLSGSLDDKEIEVEPEADNPPNLEIFPGPGLELLDFDITEMINNIFQGKGAPHKIKTTVHTAWKRFMESEINRLISKDKLIETAKKSVEENGIIFIDEIDKIANADKQSGIDVSRSGVQRDLLPIVEGSQVPTKHGMIDTSHILFIAAGAFNTAKPSDLIPELQGRFPIRVELNSLTQDDFERILIEPENSLTKQYQAIFRSEGVELIFLPGAVREIARFSALANEKMEDIGARRLHTVMNALLDDYLFEMPSEALKSIKITKKMVTERLNPIIESEDLSRFIL
ncbi:MAG TPA: ATP-dependent protease ATPase subunit HslU [Candidatus Cloacimonas sp.]|nr:ATP-dependent protease ATPase subunit HslU [Candidatus Cloacimonas sp.]HNX03183.1 ATP-dependent protease ATPase subunit HslU [Candidatus Cloacimonas sp.]HPS60868.1 ATP-dependent protease ATPase subunit HslU [Candidatus Cloacimonas sp.]